jgi:two-component system, LytTR family, sensor kinase
MKWLPQYTKKDLQILAINMPLIVILINSLLFGKRFFTEPRVLVLSGLIVLVIMSIAWFVYTWIAVTLRTRFPSGTSLIKRLAITILLIGIIQALLMTLFFQGYSHFSLFGYELNETRYYWTLAIGFLVNILITMLHEGYERFERWKTTLTETEQLKTSYAQSQLLGLKSQVNPHFLFNSLNSLSSLISEDAEQAEKFLNELTKVYRYLLRSQDEKLVPLGTELQFIRSYYYLLKVRYGDAVNLKIEVEEEQCRKYVSTFLLQTLFEYSFNNNSLVKDSPLNFLITIDETGRLLIKNNVQEKLNAAPASTAGMSNLVEKYKLLCDEQVEIENSNGIFSVKIPLITEIETNRYEISSAK